MLGRKIDGNKRKRECGRSKGGKLKPPMKGDIQVYDDRLNDMPYFRLWFKFYARLPYTCIAALPYELNRMGFSTRRPRCKPASTGRCRLYMYGRLCTNILQNVHADGNGCDFRRRRSHSKLAVSPGTSTIAQLHSCRLRFGSYCAGDVQESFYWKWSFPRLWGSFKKPSNPSRMWAHVCSQSQSITARYNGNCNNYPFLFFFQLCFFSFGISFQFLISCL